MAAVLGLGLIPSACSKTITPDVARERERSTNDALLAQLQSAIQDPQTPPATKRMLMLQISDMQIDQKARDEDAAK